MRRISLSLLLTLCTVSLALCQEFRSIDGLGNHPDNLGSVHDFLNHYTTPAFADGISSPNVIGKPNERVVSNELFSQDGLIADPMNLSDFVWVFGQFVDHDLSLVSNSTDEFLSITIPEDDQIFPPDSELYVFRSQGVAGTGTDPFNPRVYRNEVTSFLDLSNVYGSDQTRATWLRKNDGTGKLKTSQGDLLPWNTPSGEYNDIGFDMTIPHMDDEGDNLRLFVAGDVRANENPQLLAIHTLFVREHNQLCDHYLEKHPEWLGNDELLFQNARKHLIAYYQSVVFDEWLPAMGVTLPAYTGYKPEMNPSILNVFSAAAFRLGHTLINGMIIRMDNDGREIPSGNLRLKDAFFAPAEINVAGGIEPYFKGMATQIQQSLDCKIVDDVRNFLFQDGNTGLDLAAINILRGRERGLADYNTIRADFGMPPMNNFFSLTGDQSSAALIQSLYGDIDNLDPWVGMLAEKHMPDALFGELIMKIIERQFQSLRDGDRFYYEHGDQFSEVEMESIKNTNFHDLIMRNTSIDLMQDNVFVAMPHEQIPTGPKLADVQLDAIAYPNPTLNKFHIKIFAEREEKLTMNLFGILGELISTTTMTLNPGDNFTSYSIPDNMPRGMYNLHLETETANNVLRIIKEL